MKKITKQGTKRAAKTTGTAGKADKAGAARKAGAKRAVAPKAKGVDAKLFDRLVQEAKVVRERAHAPYSKYLVGAAIATKSGKIFTGCNVENASFPAGICAERGAIMQMVAAGEREPVAVAVVTRDGASPCGICRQTLVEFARDLPIAVIATDAEGGESGRVVQLAALLPEAFELTT